jgi:hypothetical protein
MSRLLFAALVVALALTSAAPSHAQSSVTPLELRAAGDPPGGWSFTPALDYAFVWDSNVLMENVGSDIVAERLHVLKPRGTLAFSSRRSDFRADYGGAFVQHPTLSSLNSFDQRVGVSGSRWLSRRTSLFGHYGFLSAPTTELLEIVGAPFTRVGVQRQDMRTGVTTRLSRKAELTATYRFQRVAFDEDLDVQTVVNGGHSNGGTMAFRYALTSRAAVIADYFIDRASVISGTNFMIQNGWSGLEYAINQDTRVFGSGGVSYLSGIDGRPSRMGPAMQLGLTREVEDATVIVNYSRSYVPSYGFGGGTSNNEELRTAVRLPLGGRVFTQSALSIRRNEPLEQADLRLRSTWFHGSVGYLLNDWARIEAYTAGSRQQIARAGGRVHRYTFGVQITAATTTRIR